MLSELLLLYSRLNSKINGKNMILAESSRIIKHIFCPRNDSIRQKTEFIENTEDDFHVSNPDPLKKLSQKEKEEAQVCNLA